MPDPQRASMRLQVCLFLALLITYAYFFQGGGWHQNSRFDLTRAIVEDGSVRINRFAGNTHDWARVENRLLSNKAPGLSFLAAPLYAVLRSVLPAGDDDPFRMSIQVHFIVIFTVSLASAILGVVILRFLHLWANEPSIRPVVCLLAYSLGSLAFPWSTQLMAHQLGAALLFGAAALIYAEKKRDWSGGDKPLLLAGVILGLAGTVEETSIFVIPILLAYGLWVGGWRRALMICAGGIGPAAALATYNAFAFGGPLLTAHDFQNPRFVTGEPGTLLGVLGAPDLRVLLELTFLPRRGLFYYCPVLLFAAAGLVAAVRRRESRPEAVTFLSAFIVVLLFNASFNGWHGGWSTGPRYLIPALPFLAVGLVWTPRVLRSSAWVAGAISIVLMTAVTAVNVSVPQDNRNAAAALPPGESRVDDVRDPVRNYVLPRFASGDLSVHRQHMSESFIGQRLSPPEQKWAAYNVGELMGLRGLSSLVPLLLSWIVLGSIAAWRPRRSSISLDR
ncbi:MAG: hypothetical protein O6952_01585 [Planctomycetota bacterium]|nr:hypothetical protein [Planctomycetota bacterium]